jgi:hypothetical protein
MLPSTTTLSLTGIAQSCLTFARAGAFAAAHDQRVERLAIGEQLFQRSRAAQGHAGAGGGQALASATMTTSTA